MTPQEFVKLSDECQEMKSICAGLKYDYIESVLKLQYIKAQLLCHRIQEKMKQGKFFHFKWYGHTHFINQIVSVQNPLIKRKVEDFNTSNVETFYVDVKVEYIDEYKNKKYVDIPINGICEYVDPQKINPDDYVF